VKGACELLGINFLHVANEGVLIAIVSPEIAEELVDTMKGCNEGINAAIIGEVQKRDYKFLGSVLLKTSIGGMTIVDMPLGEQLPRIC
ncbi:MAG: AIR synthase-related protein, partial [Thermodesulfovibrionales bacterium]|nr:AIR synthase-related protein [Thermodesulfovibrionales bacterium]